jgi:hypothetical protein
MSQNSKLSGHQIADLTVILMLSGSVVWYVLDAYQASSHIINLILIVPISIVALVLCSVEFAKQLLGKLPPPKDLESISSVLPVMSLFVVFVLSLEWLGFDVGTMLFVGAFLWIHGERRIAWVLGYSLGFALLLSLFFSNMLPYPMPMLILPTAY